MDLWLAHINADLAVEEFVRTRRGDAGLRYGEASRTLAVVAALAALIERGAARTATWARQTRGLPSTANSTTRIEAR